MVASLLSGAKMRSVLPATVQVSITQSSSLPCPDEQRVNKVDILFLACDLASVEKREVDEADQAP